MHAFHELGYEITMVVLTTIGECMGPPVLLVCVAFLANGMVPAAGFTLKLRSSV